MCNIYKWKNLIGKLPQNYHVAVAVSEIDVLLCLSFVALFVLIAKTTKMLPGNKEFSINFWVHKKNKFA